MSRSAPCGVAVIDKPSGPTSHDVVDRVRRAVGLRRVGHTGTLDPFATGVLPVCVGSATRLARFLAGGDKVYHATLRLGFATTTDDLHGEPLGEPRPVRLDEGALRRACAAFVGEIAQVPPRYSAKRVDGARLYELARRGVETERRACRVQIHALELLAVEGDTLALQVRCAAGTYVRALARDLGEALGVGGHLVALRRTRSGEFSLEQALSWDEIGPGLGARLVPLEALLRELPAVSVGDDGLRALRQGRDLRRAQVREGFPEAPPPARLRVLHAASGALVALAVPRAFAPPAPGLPFEPALHADLVLADEAG